MSVDVLSIEDDPNVAIAIRRMLQLCGCKVRTASSGEQGLQLCEEHMPSLVLLDIGLPGLDGLETLRRIKKLDVKCPVVMMTAHQTISMVMQAIELGASDYLAKPVTLEDLQATVTKFIAVPIPEKKEVATKGKLVHIQFSSGGLSLDDLERQVIEEALKHTHGNISKAARLLHISRHTLHYRMRKHGLRKIDENV